MSDQPTLYEHCPAECGKHRYGRRMQRDFCGVCKNEGYVVAALAGTELYELDRRKFDAATYPAFQELEWREVLVRVGKGDN